MTNYTRDHPWFDQSQSSQMTSWVKPQSQSSQMMISPLTERGTIDKCHHQFRNPVDRVSRPLDLSSVSRQAKITRGGYIFFIFYFIFFLYFLYFLLQHLLQHYYTTIHLSTHSTNYITHIVILGLSVNAFRSSITSS